MFKIFLNIQENLESIRLFNKTVHEKSNDFPTEKDFHGAIKALLQLEDTYHFDLAKAADGDLDYFTK